MFDRIMVHDAFSKCSSDMVYFSILLLLSSKSFEDINSFQEKSKLEDEIIVRVNKFLTTGKVNGAYFTEFIMQ